MISTIRATPGHALMSERDTLAAIAEHLALAFAPLREATADLDSFVRFMLRLGWSVESLPQDFVDLGGNAAQLAIAVEALIDDPDPETVEATFTALRSLVTAIDAVDSAGAPVGVDPATFAAEVGERLGEQLLTDYLVAAWPGVSQALETLGILVIDYVDETATRPGHIRRRLDYNQFGTLVSDPLAAPRRIYGWGTPDIDFPRLAFHLIEIIRALGPAAMLGRVPVPLARSFAGPDGMPGMMLRIPLVDTEVAGMHVELGLSLLELPPEAGKLGGLVLLPLIPSQVQRSIPLSSDVSLEIGAASNIAQSFGVVMRPDAIALRYPGAGAAPPTLDFDAALRYAPRTPRRLVDVGGAVGIELGGMAVALAIDAAAADSEVALSLDLDGLAIAIGGGKVDGFLAKMLPGGGLRVPIDLGLRWSSCSGVSFRGGAGFDVTVKPDLALGPIKVDAVRVALAADATNQSTPTLRAFAAAVFSGKVGPVRFQVTEIGFQLAVEFRPGNAGPVDLTIGFKPPTGVGLKIDAGPVSGGGYLFFDHDAEQYGGIVQLSIKKKIALNAIALLTTRLPGLPPGQRGFSLLLIITAEFPPMPLGFGFTLNGIGGLIGINRTMMLDPLRDGVRDRSIEGILFPQDPLANAASLIGALQRIFPPAEGRFVFGPMVKVGWGPTQLITIEAALILELPSPLRLVLLGRMCAVLPDKNAAVVDLRLDVVGILDFDRSEASIDASFVDSRLAGFTLTGDMALRLGWGATKAFALAAGGFNPRFTPPPGFPVLRRLSLSLADSENPRFRLESYLALTANTIQFGARAELSAQVQTAIGDLGAAAMIFFDALIELDPFGFIVDLGATIEVTLGGRPLIQAQLMATLSGTKPWHAVGFVEVVFLGRHRIPFEARAGDPQPTTLPMIDLLPKLTEEIARLESWITLPPPEAADMVVLRDAGASGAALLHPLGGVALHQRLLPFGKRLTRFGSATPEGGGAMFVLKEIVVAGRSNTAAPLLDDFAPGQYEALSEDEKLARPAFERMQAGGEATTSLAMRLPAADPRTGLLGTHIAIDYEERVIDQIARPSRITRRRKKPVMATGLIAAMADDGIRGDLQFDGPKDRAIAVPGERWRAASADHLDAVPGGTVGSAAEAQDHRRLGGRPADATTVIAIHEAA